mgnify:CR=1 FL=1
MNLVSENDPTLTLWRRIAAEFIAKCLVQAARRAKKSV